VLRVVAQLTSPVGLDDSCDEATYHVVPLAAMRKVLVVAAKVELLLTSSSLDLSLEKAEIVFDTVTAYRAVGNVESLAAAVAVV